MFCFKLEPTSYDRKGELVFHGDEGDTITDEQSRTMAIMALADACNYLAASAAELARALEKSSR